MTTIVTEADVQEVQLQDAKATLSAVVDQARAGQPSVITRHGCPEAVVVSFEEWQRLSQIPSFGRLLMAAPLEDDDLPPRQGGLRDAGLCPLYLIDTNVLSAEAPIKAVAAPDLVTWMDRNSAGLFLSVIAVAEVEDGIAKAHRQGATRKAERLSEWLKVLLHLYGVRIIAVDLRVARHMGRLIDLARSKGHDPDLVDVAIAATALQHNHTF